jgi:hypothetical protein
VCAHETFTNGLYFEKSKPIFVLNVHNTYAKAINEYGDLMRMSIASPGNDFRLGACEAPPSIVSTCLGRSMTAFLVSYLSKCGTLFVGVHVYTDMCGMNILYFVMYCAAIVIFS